MTDNSTLHEIISSFSTREWAIIVWVTIALLIWLIRSKDRSPVSDFLKTAFEWEIIGVLTVLATYQATIIYGLHKIGLWEIFMLKDALLWYFTVGIAILFKLTKVKNNSQLRKTVFKGITLTVVFEFMMNFYTYAFWIEMLTVPVTTMLIITHSYAEINPRGDDNAKKVKKPLGNIISFLGIIAISIVLYRTITEYETLLTKSNLLLIVMPFIVLILTVPLFYALALFFQYEGFLVRIKRFTHNDPILWKDVRRAVYSAAGINLNKLAKVQDNFNKSMIFNFNSIDEFRKTLLKQSHDTDI